MRDAGIEIGDAFPVEGITSLGVEMQVRSGNAGGDFSRCFKRDAPNTVWLRKMASNRLPMTAFQCLPLCRGALARRDNSDVR